MEPLLVYGFPLGSSMGLVAALEWLGRPYHLCRVDMLSESKTAAGYARLNRRLETPVLITDEGRVLTETMAIALWLETRDSDRRISFDPRTPEADRMHQLMAFVNTGFTAAFSPLWAALEMTLDADTQKGMRWFGRRSVVARHDRLEEMIGDTPFLLGDRPSLADGVLVGVARWLEFHEVAKVDRWPRIAALRRRIEAEPAVRFATALESGETVPGSGALQGHVPLAEVIRRFGT